LLFKGNRFAAVPTPFTLQSPTETQVVAGKLVMWGGPANANPPPKLDADCKAVGTRAIDGVVLDPATAKWTPMTSGPPVLADVRGFSKAGFMYVYGRAGGKVVLWRYDVANNAWKQLGELPASFEDRDLFTPNDAVQVGSTIVLNHGGKPAAQVVIDLDTGSLHTSEALPIEPAAFVAIDKTHVLLIPHPAQPAPTAYIEDLDTHAWCELPWFTRSPFFQRDKSTFIGIAASVGDKLLVWLDGPATGYLASFQ
jgi:hypothetical protein